MTFEEPEGRELWGWIFRATDAVCNAIKRDLDADPRSTAWREINTKIQHGTFSAFDASSGVLCSELVHAEEEMEKLAWKVIQKHTKEDR